MANINNIITVNISSVTKAVQLPGFGIPNIIGTTSSTIAKGTSNLFSDMIGVGSVFNSSAPEWIAANAIFAQTPAPTNVMISRELDRVSEVATIVFSGNLITGNTITGLINNTTITVPFNTDNEQTMDDLATALTIAGVSTAVDTAADTITITSAIAGISFVLGTFTVTGGASQVTAVNTITTPNTGIGETIAAVALLTPNFYGIIWTERTLADVIYAASVIEGLPYLFISANNSVSDYNPASTTDLMAVLKAGGYTRTAALFSGTFNTQFGDAAWMGSRLWTPPGSENWSQAQLNGVTVDNLTDTQISAILAKNGNVFVPYANFNVTRLGTCGSGLFIDIRRGIDWLISLIKGSMFTQLVNAPNGKVPYTDPGVSSLLGILKACLHLAEKSNFIQPGWTAFSIPVADIPGSDIAARNYPGFSFNAKYVGAINTVQPIQGFITAF